ASACSTPEMVRIANVPRTCRPAQPSAQSAYSADHSQGKRCSPLGSPAKHSSHSPLKIEPQSNSQPSPAASLVPVTPAIVTSRQLLVDPPARQVGHGFSGQQPLQNAKPGFHTVGYSRSSAI